jgi:broad specificity phosphatase PhoE
MELKPQKTIYFFRHGQSEGNIRHINATDEDIHPAEQHLTELGREQVYKLAKRIPIFELDVLLSSTLTRARETTEIIGQHSDYNIEYSDLFVERQKPSSIIGKLRSDELVLATEKAWKHSLFNSGEQVEDGDSYDTLIARADKALELLQSRPEAVLGVITHGFFLNTVIMRAILGDTINPVLYQRLHKQSWQDNTGMMVLQYSPEYPYTGWKIITYNDTAHLDCLKG